jgi:hypothetical protein
VLRPPTPRRPPKAPPNSRQRSSNCWSCAGRAGLRLPVLRPLRGCKVLSPVPVPGPRREGSTCRCRRAGGGKVLIPIPGAAAVPVPWVWLKCSTATKLDKPRGPEPRPDKPGLWRAPPKATVLHTPCAGPSQPDGPGAQPSSPGAHSAANPPELLHGEVEGDPARRAAVRCNQAVVQERAGHGEGPPPDRRGVGDLQALGAGAALGFRGLGFQPGGSPGPWLPTGESQGRGEAHAVRMRVRARAEGRSVRALRCGKGLGFRAEGRSVCALRAARV